MSVGEVNAKFDLRMGATSATAEATKEIEKTKEIKDEERILILPTSGRLFV